MVRRGGVLLLGLLAALLGVSACGDPLSSGAAALDSVKLTTPMPPCSSPVVTRTSPATVALRLTWLPAELRAQGSRSMRDTIDMNGSNGWRGDDERELWISVMQLPGAKFMTDAEVNAYFQQPVSYFQPPVSSVVGGTPMLLCGRPGRSNLGEGTQSVVAQIRDDDAVVTAIGTGLTVDQLARTVEGLVPADYVAPPTNGEEED